MARLVVGLGSLLFEIASLLTDGALGAAMLVTGSVMTMLHMATQSLSLQAVVNRLTGCDLPEAPRDLMEL